MIPLVFPDAPARRLSRSAENLASGGLSTPLPSNVQTGRPSSPQLSSTFTRGKTENIHQSNPPFYIDHLFAQSLSWTERMRWREREIERVGGGGAQREGMREGEGVGVDEGEAEREAEGWRASGKTDTHRQTYRGGDKRGRQTDGQTEMLMEGQRDRQTVRCVYRQKIGKEGERECKEVERGRIN